MRGWLSLCCALLVATNLTGCGSKASGQSERPVGEIRVATYNLQWFSEDANPERLKNLRSVLSHVSADVYAFEEVESEQALRQLFDSSWDVGMLNDRSEHQELAIVVRKPFVLISADTVFKDPDLDDAFPGKRDVLRCVVQTPQDKAVVLYIVHMKSRRGGRMETDVQREKACGLLAAYLKGQRDEPNTVVLGDFNDNPRDASLNILESGDNLAKGGDNKNAKVLLVNLTEKLASQDMVSEGVHSLFRGAPIRPVAPGAAKDNDRLRGRDYQFPQDVKVPQILFDQILVSPSLSKSCGTPVVYCGMDALRGEAGKVNVGQGSVEYSEKGDLASDHLPVYVDIKVP